jgi:4-hydroxy-3-methylbut-2-enyl diphosphate reductase
MQIILAEAMGWCFGVRDAVDLALSHPERGDLTIVGELVHDETVLAALRGAGIRFTKGFDEPIVTRRALITAHGASRAAIEALRARGLVVEEATCPLVKRAHDRLARFVAEGRAPVVIGRHGHVEVLGLTGDFAGAAIVETEADAAAVPDAPRLGVVAQTTQPLDEVLALVAAIRRARPRSDVAFADTICHPTKERQAAVRRLAAQVQRVVVVGGPRSHNTRRLVETCESMGVPADRVQRPEDLDASRLAGLERVGLTAGTSAPDEAIAAVLARLRAIAAAAALEKQAAEEDRAALEGRAALEAQGAIAR